MQVENSNMRMGPIKDALLPQNGFFVRDISQAIPKDIVTLAYNTRPSHPRSVQTLVRSFNLPLFHVRAAIPCHLVLGPPASCGKNLHEKHGAEARTYLQ